MAAPNVNLCGSPTDAHQRYKRQVAVLQHVKGKNQTILKNAASVSKSLGRSIEFIAKYLSSELACKSKVVNDEIVVNGIFGVQAVEEKLSSCTARYVLCNVCSNPETALRTKKGAMLMHCIACGADSEVKKCDEKIFKLVAACQPAKQKKGKGPCPDQQEPPCAEKQESDDEKVEWTTDASDEASASRRSQISSHANALTQ